MILVVLGVCLSALPTVFVVLALKSQRGLDRLPAWRKSEGIEFVIG